MPDAIVRLMQERFEKEAVAPLDPSALFAAAVKIDPRGFQTEQGMRPFPRALFAAAAAEVLAKAMAEGEADIDGLIGGLDREDILDSLIYRDRAVRWLPAAATESGRLERHENLLALATMCLGVTRAALNDPAARSLRDDILPQSIDQGLMQAMGSPLPEISIVPMEPDILGEHFALSRLASLRDQGLLQSVIDACFSIGGNDFAVFCLRCLNDFPERAKELALFLPSIGTGMDGALLFSGLSIDLVRRFGETGAWDRVDLVLGRIGALRQGFPDNEEIALREAQAAFNVTSLAGGAGDWDRVDAMLRRIDVLRQGFPDNLEIALEEAKAVVNVGNYAGALGDKARVEALFDRIDALRQAFPGNEDIATEEAKAAVNDTSDAGAAGEWDRVDAILGRIDALRQGFPKNEQIARREAQAAVNATNHASAAGDWDRVDAMLGRIDALRQDFPDNEEIALEEAKVAVNVTSRAGAAGEWDRVDAMLGRIDALRQGLPDNEEIALEEAKAAFNVTSRAGAAGGWDRMDAIHDRINILVPAFAGTIAIVSICGHAVAARYAAYRVAGQTPDEEQTSEAVAGAMALVAWAVGNGSQRGIGLCLGVIKDAVARFPGNEEIAEVHDWASKAGADWDKVPGFD